MLSKTFRSLLLTVLFALMISACTSGRMIVVRKAPPPPPRHEVVGVRTKAGAVWIPGHWRWDRRKQSYVWISGKWVKAKPGHRWVPGHWRKVPGGWVWIEGHWVHW